MRPHLSQFAERDESGIRRVVEAYFRHLPDFGIELVPPDTRSYDLQAVHAGMARGGDVAHCHGLYWTADYDATGWEWRSNADVVASLREAYGVSVPSEWVAETLRRDMRVNPTVIGHGVDWETWQRPVEYRGWVLWNKNRVGDVCDPTPVSWLARSFPDQGFLCTISPENPPPNVRDCGVLPHEEMRRIVAASSVYLATTKETFGIGTLEAMAAGVPVLGFAHGGNLQLVQHGVNGYLARAGDREDLQRGLAYCLSHRETLGRNGRELARAWTWAHAAEAVAQLYERSLAAKQEPPSVAVIIPSYKYAEKVGRAIESATQQDWPMLEAIVVVDDGTPDDGATARLVESWTARDPRVRYLRQENAGVAHARNHGIASVGTKYVCCLDADDRIEPGFLRACVMALEEDRTRGLAYTGLQWVKPDGTSGVSAWPGVWDYDAQLRRQNQVPTCCVFRREMWARLGGFRQRYAPRGAGAEDAEFWTRCGAYGWSGYQATAEPLFVYSWLSGHVTGAKDYQEVDWLRWHPWVQDSQHPIASLATPKRMSHASRQYDEPVVSVLIPVGPGHERTVIDALDSLEAQTFRKWEAIVVIDGAFVGGTRARADQFMNDDFEQLRRAYPYARWLVMTNDKHLVDGKFQPRPRGAGAARNFAAEKARAPFLVPLDADDYLHPDALSDMLGAWAESGAIIYSDYVGRAQVDDPKKLAPALQERLYKWDQGEAYIGYQAGEFDAERAQRQPEDPPYIWANVTCLIPKAWHEGIGGFDETMASWEDVDYAWRMARAGHCYVRIEKELMVYRFNTGGRREAGLQGWAGLVEYLRAKYRETQLAPCNCGGQKSIHPPPAADWAAMGAAGANGQGKGPDMADEQYVMAKYMHPNVGVHGVRGADTGTDYGYRSGGDTFLVHRKDVAAQPHLFQPLESAPQLDVAPPPPPEPVELPPPEPVMSETQAHLEAVSEALASGAVVSETGDDIDWAKTKTPTAKRAARARKVKTT